ncbi:lytic transglycosylase domain-containing protein [Sphingomonas xanthus]|nr:lytic transglycosylase domain-containing protein [Sphingomonas xanthus]
MRGVIALLMLTAAYSAMAQESTLAEDPLAPVDENDTPTPVTTSPTPPPQPVIVKPLVIPKNWREVFAAIRASDWPSAQAGIATLPDGLLKPVAQAELFTARNSPRVELEAVVSLLARAPDLPKASQLQRIALARGATSVPTIPREARMVPLGSAPRRQRARPIEGEPAAVQLRTALQPFVDANSPVEAEALFQQALPTLSYEARAEAAQRVAWIYYVTGQDEHARRVAQAGIPGAVGVWATQAHWVAGLASWRLDDCNSAAMHFRAVASGQAESELNAAGAYWASRAEIACRRPQAAEGLLKLAARSPESFYGLVARETLGMDKRLPELPNTAFERIERLPNIQRALQLIEIGEYNLAEEHIRHQARIGSPADHPALISLSRRLDFAGAQYWLAHNGPSGSRVPAAARYPLPRWTPQRGWRIDPALAYAHARQESDFRIGAISSAGAVGLMQVRPGTAGDFARARGETVGDLRYPPTNLEYGQSFIEMMRRNPITQGQLLKVMAAYNAGPVPVSRWNYINDKGDPLLWIESLPYWETRYYIPAVLRNFWVNQGLQNDGTPTLTAIAEHRWPDFPTRR